LVKENIVKVLNKTNSIQYLPDGDGNKVALKAGIIIDGKFIPGENEIPSRIMDKIKECIGPERWPNYAQFIIVEGDKVIDPIPVKQNEDLTVEELLPIIKETVNDKLLIDLVNSENLRDIPRKTVTEAIEKRMIALNKAKKKDGDGKHDKE
jgi:uncharacterized protein